MGKKPAELKHSIKKYVEALEPEVKVEKVFLSGDYASGDPGPYSDIRLVVISPSFDEIPAPERIGVLGSVSAKVEPLIQAWGYTPRELDDLKEGRSYIPLLAMLLNESREVYSRRADAPQPRS